MVKRCVVKRQVVQPTIETIEVQVTMKIADFQKGNMVLLAHVSREFIKNSTLSASRSPITDKKRKEKQEERKGES